MLSNMAKVLTFTASAILFIMSVNKIVCEIYKQENTRFLIYERELLKSFQNELDKNIDLRSIDCDDIKKKSYKHYTPVEVVATDGVVADLKTIYKYAQMPETIRKAGVDVYLVESFYKFLSFMYAYSTVNLSIHGISDRSKAILMLDTVVRVNFTMGLTLTQLFVNVTKVELLNCTVTKQLIKTAAMYEYMTPHVIEMFYEHFLRKEKPKVENVIKDTFQAITNNITSVLDSR